MGFIKKYAPGLWNFLKGFFDAMTNRKEGQSLRKWLAVGFFWLVSVMCIRFTDSTNVVSIVTILCSMITSLVITYTVGNFKEQKLDKQPDAPKTDLPPTP